MKLTDETWYIVRNTPGVTGFVGSGTEPTPVSDAEISKIKKRMGVEDPKHQIDFQPGEVVNITDGPFKGFDGAVSEIDTAKGKLKVMVSMFGRDTPVELDALPVSYPHLDVYKRQIPQSKCLALKQKTAAHGGRHEQAFRKGIRQ